MLQLIEYLLFARGNGLPGGGPCLYIAHQFVNVPLPMNSQFRSGNSLKGEGELCIAGLHMLSFGGPEWCGLLPVELLETGVRGAFQIGHAVADQGQNGIGPGNPAHFIVKPLQVKPVGGLGCNN